MLAKATQPAKATGPPRAAAVAGVVFSALMSTSLILIRLAIPAAGHDRGAWLDDELHRNAVRFAIQLAPFAGIAFLWFIAVLRNLAGALEDRFFSTVFLGSGLMFVASLFASAAFASALVETAASGRFPNADTETYFLARQLVGSFLNVFAIKMEGVFMISTSTLVYRTAALPRWVPFSGYASALVLLFVITSWRWIALLFPLWILLLSASILIEEFLPGPARQGSGKVAGAR